MQSENFVITIYQSSYKKFPYDVILIRVWNCKTSPWKSVILFSNKFPF